MPWHFEYNRVAGKANNTPPPPLPPRVCLNCQAELPAQNAIFRTRACATAHRAKLAAARCATHAISAERRRGMETVTHGNLARGDGE